MPNEQNVSPGILPVQLDPTRVLAPSFARNPMPAWEPDGEIDYSFQAEMSRLGAAAIYNIPGAKNYAQWLETGQFADPSFLDVEGYDALEDDLVSDCMFHKKQGA